MAKYLTVNLGKKNLFWLNLKGWKSIVLVGACSYVGRSMRLASIAAEMEQRWRVSILRPAVEMLFLPLSLTSQKFYNLTRQEVTEEKDIHKLEVNLGYIARANWDFMLHDRSLFPKKKVGEEH